MSLCGDVDAAGIRIPLHRFAGTIRRNKHRDDRARGRLQNPLAHNDVRAGEPSRRWEARWNKWKGQAQEALEQAVEITSGVRACLLCFERDHSGCHRAIVAAEMADREAFQIRHLGVRHGLAKEAGYGDFENGRAYAFG